ncbi:uncharacterized protein LOC112560864 [Pomacea canaliculata]|nr:uncharacterized protein LOC112560864 [Pomacea canaliculata]
MWTEKLLVVAAIFLSSACAGHININERREPPQLVRKLDLITKQLRSLSGSLEDLDSDLRRALSLDSSGNEKRADATDSSSCTGFRDSICQAMELLKYLDSQNGYLGNPASPGKRSADVTSLAKYQRILSDMRQKQREVESLHNVINTAGHVMERQKKWFSCHLNLGFTCQTQEYADIADYYDFLNSAESPGKKRAVLIPQSP